MLNAGILGMGSYLPENIVTNFDLEKRMDTSDEWIRSRTGIEERRYAADDINTSDMGYFAAKEALKQADILPEQLDLIIVATVTGDYSLPAVAAIIQDRLGAHKAAAMDVNAVCTGFVYGLVTGKQFIQTGDYKYVLVVGAEKISKILNFEDRNTAVIFGDGAGAAVLGPVSKDKGILAFELGANGSGYEHIIKKDQYLSMNGREVYKFAVRQLGESALNVIHKAGLTKDDVDYLVPHQANIRIMEAARQRLDLPVEKMSKTVDKFGNTSAASIPMSLVEDLKNGKIKDGDIVVLVGFGGGLTWGSVVMRWGK